MHFFRLILTLMILFSSELVYAQLNNEVLLQKMPVNPDNANEIRINVFASGFSKNNEYFNKIADGYTLFGYQLNPRISYQPAAFVRIDAGVFAWKDFGSSGYQELRPTFTVKIQEENWAFLFGTLEGTLSHGYIEPLYDFERVILDRLENGMQYLFQAERFRMDAWINWNKMIYVADPDQEEVEGGISSAVTLLNREGKWGPDHNFIISLPLQFTAQHKGGQIDNNDQPLLTVVNTAVGLELEKKYPFELLRRLYTKNYVVGFKDFSNELLLPYESGTGLYLNIGADTKYQDVMLSYWQGNGYVSELGGRLYQSASTTYKNPDFLQQERRLLILRLMKDVEILENLHLTFRLEPVLDLDNPALEFSNSFFLTFDTDFFVAKKK